MPEIGGDARAGAGLQIGRVQRHRHQERYGERKRQPQPAQPVVQIRCGAFAAQARPDEQAREKEKQGHQKDVLPGAIKVEPEPALAVDNRECAPEIGRAVEGKGGGGQKIQIGKNGMERQHQQDDDRPQIAEREARPRGWPRSHRPSVSSGMRSSALAGWRVSAGGPMPAVRNAGRGSRAANGSSRSGSGIADPAAGSRGRPISAGWNSTAAAMVQSQCQRHQLAHAGSPRVARHPQAAKGGRRRHRAEDRRPGSMSIGPARSCRCAMP